MMKNQQAGNDKKILTLVEAEDGEIPPITLELLQAGRGLAAKAGGKSCAAVLGYKVEDLASEIAHFTDEVYALDDELLNAFQVDFYAQALWDLCQNLDPDIFLMGHTLDNLDLAPKLACKMGTTLTTDCSGLDIDPETGLLLTVKPVYGDNGIVTFLNEKRPQMATVRAMIFEAADRGQEKGRVIQFKLTIDKSLAKTELIETVSGERVSLDKADVIVAGGRGIKNRDGLKDLEEFIDVLKKYFNNVELGASRPLIDAGWLPLSRQIGLTGEKVAPELYVAVGISGSLQHLTGINGSKKIVAINKDEQSPIFKYSDYGIVGEYEKTIPALIKKIKELP